MNIYKACDIRGVYKKDLTLETAKEIGLGIGTLLDEKKIIVGGDVRISTPAIKENLITGLIETGCEVTDIGIIPTPVFYFAKNQLEMPAGAMVTASHNPAKYNGFKIIFGNMPVTPQEIKNLEEIVSKKIYRLSNSKGKIKNENIIEKYNQFINTNFADFCSTYSKYYSKNKTKFKIVVDCGNGCYSNIAPKIFKENGFEVIELFCEEDGNFPNRDPNPSVAENLKILCETVLNTKADLGIAFDGDGDRVIFVDEKGHVAESDKMIALLSKNYLLLYPGGKIVFDIKCSSLVSDEISKSGGMPVMEKSGHAFIKTTLLKEKAILGGEISGHYFFGTFGNDDGLFAGLIFSEIIKRNGGSLNLLISKMPSYFITHDIRIPYSGNDKKELIEELEKALISKNECMISRIDGLRAEFPEGWGLIRISVTEPLFTFRFEAKQKEDIEVIKDKFLGAVPKLKIIFNSYHSKI